MNVEGKVFAVTGAGSGMGAAIVLLLARRGARAVAASEISAKRLEAIKDSAAQLNLGTKIRMTVLDVASSSAVEDWIQDAIATFGDLHGAVNSAGLPQTNWGQTTDKSWNRVWGINLDGVFYCTCAQIRAMEALGIPKSDRAIVNIASMASLKHDPDVYAYRSSKAANAHFTQSVAEDVSKFGIWVNAVSPGSTATPVLREFTGGKEPQLNDWKSRGWKIIEPDDVARVVVWLLSEDSRSVFGANLNIGAALP
ncbi:uncharacterized protein A1O5_11420 [Cladophialophora psammophila CBS 110553]|uniref:3-oxoacyl-[acyl-carrier protein] reductase n=1 Tax=Cladophialophora psammophila CBS 110553 TaxID=1182543 RepID=W9WZI2_9EURO|nr:uncharacterized protein A1O5_11420 [Cladophialophora psammophila CBS 110553]EXJ63659.1 hypothetical protein A1O5_11420 [Cladophialophora psammophila CBS 110553]